MAQSFTAKNIHTKLDELSLLQDNFDISPKKETEGSTKSLLSTRLAGEKYDGAINIPENILVPVKYTDEHPEPELLATSVGKELDGRIIPSSSTISLLSLNSNNFLSLNNDSYQSNKPAQFPPLLDRKNSHPTLIASRNSITHLNQQRLQPYLKINSPSVPANADFHNSTSPQVIPLSRNHSFQHITPDSPNLDPVSLGGSPSRFWLSSQTPPKSHSGSFSRSHVFPMTQLHSTPHTTQQNGQYFAVGSANSVSKAINIKGSGGDSPVLNPVQTPIEDMPMTPLYLNSEKNSYFVLTNEVSAGGRHTKDFKFRNELDNNCLEEEDGIDELDVDFLSKQRQKSDINMD